MMGRQVTFDHIPYFFTDQYDVGMEFSGWFGFDGYEQIVTRGDVGDRAFHAFWLSGRQVVAAMQVNLWDDGIAPAQEMIRGGQPVDPDLLADSSVPLLELVNI